MEFNASEFNVGGLSPYLACDWDRKGFGTKDGQVFSTREKEDILSSINAIEGKEIEQMKQDVNGFEFGHAALRKHFSLNPQIKYLNHGSFGATLNCVSRTRFEWMKKQEENPWLFLELFVPFGYRRAAEQVAKFVGCEPENLVFTPNATTSTATVVRSLPLKSEDSILITNFTYAAVKKVVHLVCSEKGAKIVMADILNVLDDEQKLLATIESALRPSTKYAIFDHIISETATILPIKKLIELCRKRGIVVIIDGAHAVGQIPIDLRDLDPDYYVSNCHKWLCSGKGCAFLYVNKEKVQTEADLDLSRLSFWLSLGVCVDRHRRLHCLHLRYGRVGVL
eukprot:TRINITY_DN6735_c0_g1_i1.p1 TRINITY_DN6735_c0_g1~~TRINITY_DN6735_c0_g1_i1.p1  ORF type:complete len:348 (-),score=46.16 TRINITY_DN6735_c0_g1_i1:352-1365(-)